jgi:cell division protein FtsL
MKEQQREMSRLMISQAWLVKNIPFFLFLSALAVVYIYNGHHAEKSIKDINKTSRELKNLQYEFKMVRSEWMFMTKQSEVVEAVKSMGLNEIAEPPAELGKALGENKKN